MNVGFAFNPAAFARSTTAPTQAQVNAQVSSGSGSDFARDRVVRGNDRTKSLAMVGARTSRKGIEKKAAAVGQKKRA